ncbi:hypothetical protein N7474_000033 [Penicillium riverlandense]|uniref:uncharacterized protein n=1 Tax=Penicillium riverlandense TaxID=1903569 RepID=UPI002547D86A|nr:uncharacterized protein N7474_000033 [Penicillium riverlandense]KAJ5831722.1 hypothetical protein N7474_000033 [Penicillium riverlandense]
MGMGMMGGGMMGGGMMGGGWGPPPVEVLVDSTGVWDTAGAGEAQWAVDMVTVQASVAEDLVALDQGVDLEADDVAGDAGVDEVVIFHLDLIANRKPPNNGSSEVNRSSLPYQQPVNISSIPQYL